MLFGLMNVVVAALTLWLLRPLILRFSTLALVTVVLSTGLYGGLIHAERIEKFVERDFMRARSFLPRLPPINAWY